jgi:lipoate-protein ligase A
MRYCDLTLPTPEENLACDEALLDWAESLGAPAPGGQSSPLDGAASRHDAAGETPSLPGILRFWEPSRYFAVLGYANRLATEVNTAFCRQNTIPVLRRCTGGGTVLQGPGILNYTLILPTDTPPYHNVTATNHSIMEQHRRTLESLLGAPVETRGHTDLAIGGLKFSGNAQRRRKHFLLFHGSFLLHFDIELLEKALPLPSIEPDYRFGRRHIEFLMNLKIHRDLLKQALVQSWNATGSLDVIPYDRIDALVRAAYSREEWNARF